MAELFDLKETEERVVLIAVSTGDGDDAEASLKELAELVKTAGAVSTDYQSPESVDHLCEKTTPYAESWKATAEELWKGCGSCAACGKKE